MYDAVLISPHYHYAADGQPIPAAKSARHQDLSLTLPLGLLYIAQHLHDTGFNLRVVHLPQEIRALERLGLDAGQVAHPIEAILKNYPARVCGIQLHFYLYCGGALRVAEMYKQFFPEATVVLGGYMATAFWPKLLDASPAIDGIVLGEGEQTFRTIVEATAAAGPAGLASVPGVACRRPNGGASARPARKADLLGLAQMPLIDPAAPPFERLRWPSRSFLNIARGRCPEPCAYCVANNPAINPRAYRTMAIDRIVEQLHVYQDRGVRGVFLGENHFLDMAFMTALIERLLQEELALFVELETHPALFASEALLPKMIEAGFRRFTVGAESGSDSLLNRLRRRVTCAQLFERVKRVAEAGGIVVTSWICNLPGETEADVRQTKRLIEDVVQAGGFVYWIENLHVLPGSRLYRNPAQWGIELLLKSPEDWIRWGQISKAYVAPAEALADPLRFLTHVNHATPPEEMMRRFFDLRRQARDLVPDMQQNLAARASRLPSALRRAEEERLEWFENRGWQLLLF